MRLLALLLLVSAPAFAQSGAETAVEDDGLAAQARDSFFAGVGLLEAGDAAEALAAFDEAASLQPNLRRAYFYGARALLELGRRDEARDRLAAYRAFDLPEAELEQAEALEQAIDAGVIDEPAPPAEVEAPREAPPPEPSERDPAEHAAELLDAADASLIADDCEGALRGTQEALRLAPGTPRAFLLRGLALECLGQVERARSVLLTYQELRAGRPDDPVATSALRRIELLQAPAEEAAPALGSDDRIRGVLDERWGDPLDRRRATRSLSPEVGPLRTARLRENLAGSRVTGSRAWIHQDDRLVWSRMRVTGRAGSESARFFADAFAALQEQVASESGEPSQVTEGASAARALAGIDRYEAHWRDRDEDWLVLRLGRCVVDGRRDVALAENVPCVELEGASGSWAPPARRSESADALAARRARTPGRRAFDFSVVLGGGGGVGFLAVPSTGELLVAPEAGADLLLRFGFGAFVAGAGWSPSVAGFADFNGLDGPYFDSRLSAYVGVRAGHRQPRSLDVLFGFGLLPLTTAAGASAAPTLSLRLVEQFRTTRLGRVIVSFEPWIMIDQDAVRIVPLRFTVGGGLGTKDRLGRRAEPDGPRFGDRQAEPQ